MSRQPFAALCLAEVTARLTDEEIPLVRLSTAGLRAGPGLPVKEGVGRLVKPLVKPFVKPLAKASAEDEGWQVAPRLWRPLAMPVLAVNCSRQDERLWAAFAANSAPLCGRRGNFGNMSGENEDPAIIPKFSCQRHSYVRTMNLFFQI